MLHWAEKNRHFMACRHLLGGSLEIRIPPKCPPQKISHPKDVRMKNVLMLVGWVEVLCAQWML